jgi:hypothetical protein
MVALTSMIASPFFLPMLFSSRAWPLLLLSKAATKKRRRDCCGPHSAETFRYAANLALNAEAVNKSNGGMRKGARSAPFQAYHDYLIKIEHRGKEDHQVNPVRKGGKCLEGVGVRMVTSEVVQGRQQPTVQSEPCYSNRVVL